MKKALFARYLSPDTPPALSKADGRFLRWVGVCLFPLLCVMVLMLSGAMEWLELEQIRFLGGNPFYIDAAVEAQNSLMGPAGLFGISIAVTLYLSLVLLRERRFSGRIQIIIPAVAVLIMPGMLCVLWGGVLNMAAPVTAALATWLAAEIHHLFRPS